MQRNVAQASAPSAASQSREQLSTAPIVKHPRSRAMEHALPDPEKHFRLMASIADTNADEAQRRVSAPAPPKKERDVGDTIDLKAPQPQDGQGTQEVVATGSASKDESEPHQLVDNLEMARFCKLHVELDRCQAAREDGYSTGLFRLLNAGAMAKGDLLAGVPRERAEWQHVPALWS